METSRAKFPPPWSLRTPLLFSNLNNFKTPQFLPWISQDFCSSYPPLITRYYTAAMSFLIFPPTRTSNWRVSQDVAVLR
jgi:hypothetical protein